MKSITVGDTNYDSVRLVHFRSINVNKNLGQNENFFGFYGFAKLDLYEMAFTYLVLPAL